jgi:hypothetical protein
LFEINEVLEGRGENIVNQTRQLVKDRELTTDEALGFFSKLQEPMNKNRERGNLLEGKNWDEAENRNEISGDFEQGKKSFDKISQDFSSEHAGFDLFSEQKKRRGIQSNSPQQQSNLTGDDDTEMIDNFEGFRSEKGTLVHESEKSDNNNPGTIALITVILALASLGIYGIVKKSKKIKK